MSKKKEDMMAVNLRPKQKAFVDEYLIDLCATRAAIRAGYSKSTAHSIGHENLSKPEIALAIQKAMKARAERTQLTADKVLKDIEEVRKVAMEAKNLHVALRASELQGKHLKMFTDKIETNVSGAIYVTTGVNRPSGDD